MTNDNEMTAAIAKANEAHKLVTRLIPVGGSELREAMAAREAAEAEFEALCAAQPCGQVDPNGSCTTCGGSGLYSPGIECGDCDAAQRHSEALADKVADVCRDIVERSPSPEERALRTYLAAMVAAGYGLECILDDNGKLTKTKQLTVDEAVEYLTTDNAPLVWFSREGGCSWRIGGRIS